MGKWYNVDLLQHTCSCAHFQYNEVPCGHAIAVIRALEHGAPRDFVPYNLTLPLLRAAYAVPMAPVGIAGLEVRYTNLNPANGDAGVALEPFGANGGSRPSTDGPPAISRHPRMALASPTKMKTFWVIKYLNIYSTNK